MLFLLTCWLVTLGLIVLAFASAGCGGNPNGPDPLPTPTPTASATPTPRPPMPPFEVGMIPSLRGAVTCCTDGGSVDLGKSTGWPFVSIATLDLYVANSITVTEVRMGPAIPGDDPGPEESLVLLEETLTAAEARGVYVLVSLIDAWSMKHGLNYWGDSPEVMQHAPQERHLEWVRRVVAITSRHRNAIPYDGNETYAVKARPVWVNGVIEEARQAGAQVVCSNARLGLGDCQLDHGFKTVPANTFLNESDNREHSVEDWLALQRTSAGCVMAWRGPMGMSEWVRLLGTR